MGALPRGRARLSGCVSLWALLGALLVTRSAAAAGPPAAFAPQLLFPVGSGPRSVAIGDLNGDGRSDLVTANAAGATVSVLFGNGDGTFAPQQTFAVGNGPYAVAIGDLNGDNLPDIAVANHGDGTVSVLLNDGIGSFAPQQTFFVGSAPTALAVGDFNGDGLPDLVVANSNDNTVSVLLNTTLHGSSVASFVPQQTFAVGHHPTSVAVGDFNGDSMPDLVVANGNDSTVSVLLNTTAAGTLSFAPQHTFAVGGNPTSVVVGDVNGDGLPDLVVANGGDNNVSVLLGDGTGAFSPQQTFPVGSSPASVTAGDVNGDGLPDLVTANGGTNNVSVLLGDGTGAFSPQQFFPVGSIPSFVAVGDLSSDGKPDLAVANSGSSTVGVLLNTLALPFAITTTSGASQTTPDGTSFPAALAVHVADANAQPVSGAVVTFTAPTSGASGTFTGGVTTIQVTTNAQGNLDTPPIFTANTTAGAYGVTASTPGANTSATFALTNLGYTLAVNTTSDGAANATNCLTGNTHTCRLRDAIAAVNQGFVPTSPTPTITFATNGTITLTGGTLTLTANMTIDGTGATIAVDGNHAATVFQVNGSVTAGISNLTIAHGGGSGGGGGIRNNGTLTVTNATLSGNVSDGAGGLLNNSGGALTLTNSTLTNNAAPGLGGGGIVNAGTMSVTNSTLTGNNASFGGGILNSGTLTLVNTLVAGNMATTGPDINGAVTAGKNNLIGDDMSMTGLTNGTNGNRVGTHALPLNALLGTLGVYGNPTGALTFPLLPGSPAIDAGDDATCALTGTGKVNTLDQRGVTRPQGMHCDIGAFESHGFILTVTSGDNQSTVVNTAFTNPLAVTVAPKSAGEPVVGGLVTFTVNPVAGASATLATSPAPINASGQASVMATANGVKGAYTVIASASGATGALTFHLTNTAPLVSIAVAPATATLKVGQVQAYTAAGTYADNTTADITAQVTWTSDTPAVAMVDTTGKATGQSAGAARIVATQGSASGQATVTVSAPTPVGISVPAAPQSRPGAATTGSGTTAPAPAPSGPVAPPGTGPAPNPAPTGR